jgi:hypothetical protein
MQPPDLEVSVVNDAPLGQPTYNKEATVEAVPNCYWADLCAPLNPHPKKKKKKMSQSPKP